MYKDSSPYHIADCIIISNKHRVEITIVETAGPFLLSNDPKETQAYISVYIDRKFLYWTLDIKKNSAYSLFK
jgi:hypothetical protein